MEPIKTVPSVLPTQELLEELRQEWAAAYDADQFSDETAHLGHSVQAVEAQLHLSALKKAERDRVISERAARDQSRLSRMTNVAKSAVRYS